MGGQGRPYFTDPEAEQVPAAHNEFVLLDFTTGVTTVVHSSLTSHYASTSASDTVGRTADENIFAKYANMHHTLMCVQAS